MSLLILADEAFTSQLNTRDVINELWIVPFLSEMHVVDWRGEYNQQQ